MKGYSPMNLIFTLDASSFHKAEIYSLEKKAEPLNIFPSVEGEIQRPLEGFWPEILVFEFNALTLS